jgi:hypothetical protein
MNSHASDGPRGISPALTLWARAALLLGSGVLLGFAVNRLHPHGVRFSSFAAPTACALPAGQAGAAAAPAVEVLSLAQVAGLCGDPRALVADARGA